MKKGILIFMFILVLIIILVLFRKSLYKPTINLKKYDIDGYNELKNYTVTNYTEGGIPKIIIKTSWHKRENIPIQIIDCLEATKNLNPDYNVYYFDDDEVIQFMKEFSEEAYQMYMKLVPGAFKADFFRVCILYKYGGCYSDIGHFFLKPLDEICEDANIVLVGDAKDFDVGIFRTDNVYYTGIHNAFMCSVPEHGFFKAIIYKIIENISINYYGESSLDITGPTMIGKLFNCYFSDKCNMVNKNMLVYGINDYSKNTCVNCKVKMLKLYQKIYDLKDTFYIVDQENTPLIQTKFDDYYYVMYNSVKKSKY